MFICLVISVSYLLFLFMDSSGFPYAYHATEPVNFYKDIASLLTSCFFTSFMGDNKLPDTNSLFLKRFSLMLIFGSCYFFVIKFFSEIIVKFILKYPVIPETLSGVIVLYGYFLTIVTTIIIPGVYIMYYFLIKPRSPKSTEGESVYLYNNRFLMIVSWLTDILFSLFVLYNIVYRHQHNHIVVWSTIIARVACFMFMANLSKKISHRRAIHIRVISFLVLCASLIVMIITGGIALLVSLNNVFSVYHLEFATILTDRLWLQA